LKSIVLVKEKEKNLKNESLSITTKSDLIKFQSGRVSRQSSSSNKESMKIQGLSPSIVKDL
jgi:hypothetical protein